MIISVTQLFVQPHEQCIDLYILYFMSYLKIECISSYCLSVILSSHLIIGAVLRCPLYIDKCGARYLQIIFRFLLLYMPFICLYVISFFSNLPSFFCTYILSFYLTYLYDTCICLIFLMSIKLYIYVILCGLTLINMGFNFAYIFRHFTH